MAEDGYREGYYSLLDASPVVQFSHYPSDEDLLTPIENAPAVMRLRWTVIDSMRMVRLSGSSAAAH